MKQANLKQNQEGIVSITVTLLFILLISLITTSFAFLMRRESQQALDRQLSTQAFYAAESGVNDAAWAISSEGLSTKTDCSGNLSSELNPVLDTADNLFEYTCALVDDTPSSLEFSEISTDTSQVMRIDAGSAQISKLRISWQSASGNDEGRFAINNNHFLPTATFMNNGTPAGNNTFSNYVGVLRTTIIPINNLSRGGLINNSHTLFLYPLSSNHTNPGADTIALRSPGSQASEGNFVDGNCHIDNELDCNVEVTGINRNVFYLRLISIYKNSQVKITAYNDSGQELPLRDSQYLVDVTGRANDVLRRIQVRLPVQRQYHYPEFALESAEGICKRMIVWDDRVTTEYGNASNPSCRLNTAE